MSISRSKAYLLPLKAQRAHDLHKASALVQQTSIMSISRTKCLGLKAGAQTLQAVSRTVHRYPTHDEHQPHLETLPRTQGT